MIKLLLSRSIFGKTLYAGNIKDTLKSFDVFKNKQKIE